MEWQPIETAPLSGYILGAWRDGSHWRFAEVFSEDDEWVNVNSDCICSPTHWMPLPPANPGPSTSIEEMGGD